jgi:predicted nucleic acid-binding protein
MGLSCLADSKAEVVIDASTAINLNATACAAAILTAIPNRFAITNIVVAELEEGRRTGRRDAELVRELVASGLMTTVTLSNEQEKHFEQLVIGPAIDTLDDGEASTIAYAIESGAIPVIDERKAKRVCRERYPQVQLGCTVDIFAHPAVEASFGQLELRDAVFAALQHARMRVLPQHIDWVVRLIGEDRARDCPSLPRAARTKGMASSDVR